MPSEAPKLPSRKLVLASASERRRKILKSVGALFEAAVPDVEEVMYRDDPRRTAAENALRKSKWARARYPDRVTIAADTVIGFKGRVIGKPADRREALRFLKDFSGERHTVITAVVLACPGPEPDLAVVESQVVFKKLTDDQIREYSMRVNPLDKAGAYDIDQHGDMIIESYTGSRTNIMGLPLEVVAEWLATHASGSRSGRGGQPARPGKGRTGSLRRPKRPVQRRCRQRR